LSVSTEKGDSGELNDLLRQKIGQLERIADLKDETLAEMAQVQREFSALLKPTKKSKR
jgi:hypothetical protein